MSKSKTTKAISVINFHGLTLWVVENEGNKYIRAKPLADLAGIDWQSAKNTLLEPDDVTLYGTKELEDPSMNAKGHLKVMPTSLYIRIDRSWNYLASRHIEPNRLLRLLDKWAETLRSHAFPVAAHH